MPCRKFVLTLNEVHMPKFTAEEWVKEYEKKGAYWLHDGNPHRPHALLSAGKHSNGFFMSKPIIADNWLLAAAAYDLVERFEGWFGHSLDFVDRVVGPATGATRLAEFVAREITGRRGRVCHWSSPVKSIEKGTGEKIMVFSPDATTWPQRGEKVFLVEDVITTGGSTERMAEAIKRFGATTFMSVGAIVNRSDVSKDPSGRDILALVHKPMPMWEASECKLCELGSEAIWPKPEEDVEGQNWARLNAVYPNHPARVGD
jgi:orotate phosphoribosyltransferase